MKTLNFLMTQSKEDQGLNTGSVLPSQKSEPFFEIHSSIGLEGNYFNQVTQMNEPFIESWSMDLTALQPTEDSEIEIKLDSQQLLYFILNHGMVVSMANIYDQATEQLIKIDRELDILEGKVSRKKSVKKKKPVHP
mmetsp:Transcript_3165/g.4824  ORF Transcript_3165/g.4824 Transcript_3165/m.4824 type:complete len:136 (-) Transcript_3165:5051-5458(-)